MGPVPIAAFLIGAVIGSIAIALLLDFYDIGSPRALWRIWRKNARLQELNDFACAWLTLDKLRKYLKESFTTADIRLDLYKTVVISNIAGTAHYFYHDADYTVVLRYSGSGPTTTVAGIGFDVEDGTVFVKQIQGVQGKHEWLRPIKWERMLLALVVEWATIQGYKEVLVQRAKHNVWSTVRDDKRGKMLYDVTAKRSGFKLDAARDVWRLTLST